MSSFLRLPVVGILAAGLFDCASNCTLISMATLCSAALPGPAVLAINWKQMFSAV
ncbi:MAG: hypothetical protein LBQ81_00580 [Zoogloeaceae bacterium]|jgi:hypothetical protein|nr:hypothetical protein [Zoogloeaceae bacterium]